MHVYSFTDQTSVGLCKSLISSACKFALALIRHKWNHISHSSVHACKSPFISHLPFILTLLLRDASPDLAADEQLPRASMLDLGSSSGLPQALIDRQRQHGREAYEKIVVQGLEFSEDPKSRQYYEASCEQVLKFWKKSNASSHSDLPFIGMDNKQSARLLTVLVGESMGFSDLFPEIKDTLVSIDRAKLLTWKRQLFEGEAHACCTRDICCARIYAYIFIYLHPL